MMKCNRRSVLFCTLFLFCCIAPNANAAEKLGTLETSSLSVMLVDVGRAASIALSPKKGALSGAARIVPKVFTIENPSRLVVDIPNSGTLQPTQKLALSHSLFSGMRLGSHPDKTRLVIDMKRDISPDFNITPVKDLGAVLINFRLPVTLDAAEGSAQQPARALAVRQHAMKERGASNLEEAPLLPVPESLKPASAAEMPKMLPLRAVSYPDARFDTGVFVTSEGVITHRGKKAPVETRPAAEGSARVEYMRFVRSKLSGLDSLAIRVEKVNGISLKPVSDSAYRLTLRNTVLSEQGELKPGLGFHSIAPQQDGLNVVVDIEVKIGVQLAADMNDGLLLLRATPAS